MGKLLRRIRRILVLSAAAMVTGWGAMIYLRHQSAAAQEPGTLPAVRARQVCRGPAPAGPAVLRPREQEVARLLENDPGQQRPRLVLNPVLAAVARQKAQDMARRNYYEHVDPDGHGANYLVLRAGYSLPDYYDHSPAGNNIESMGGGYPTAAAAWAGWMGSPGHRTHILGLTRGYRAQSEYGVGYAFRNDSEYGHYWVVLIAKPAC